MMNRTVSALLTSGAVLGSLMVGCSGAGVEAPKLTAGNPAGYAPRIEQLLADKDAGEALDLAEKLVSADPQNAAARALLGRAYLANGRYISARTAFNDALELGNRDPRTIVSLSLAEAGMGNLSGARQVLADHILDLPAGDYGLAMAMAGDPREGARALLEAARAPEADAKTRQNLAYALASGGAWAQARLIAGQDLTARDAEKRMAEWSASFSQNGESARIVAMIGVSPRADDSGLPVRLALHETPSDSMDAVQLASAEPVPAEDADTADRTEPAVAEAAFAPGELQRVLAEAPLPPRDAPSVARAPSGAMKAAFQSETSDASDYSAAFAQTNRSKAETPAESQRQQAMNAAFGRRAAPTTHRSGNLWTASLPAPASDARASDWVVQLGAYDSEAVAREKWDHIARKSASLQPFNSIHSVFELDGRTFHRLAIRGFADHGSAATACTTLKSVGQDCFVRLDDTDATRVARARAGGKGEELVARSAGYNRAAR